MTPQEAAAVLQQMKNNGAKWTTATPEERIALHDQNNSLSKYLSDGGYPAKYNALSGDWSIGSFSLYGTAGGGGGSSSSSNNGASNGYYPSPSVSVQPSNNQSLLQADSPNMGGLVAIGTVLAVLFLLK